MYKIVNIRKNIVVLLNTNSDLYLIKREVYIRIFVVYYNKNLTEIQVKIVY